SLSSSCQIPTCRERGFSMRGFAESRAWPLRGRRAFTVMVAFAVMAASLLTFTQRPAKAAGLLALGPVNPATLIPASYTDANGTSLQPCLLGPPMCFGTAADLLDPAAGEAFYQLANVDVPTAAGPGRAGRLHRRQRHAAHRRRQPAGTELRAHRRPEHRRPRHQHGPDRPLHRLRPAGAGRVGLGSLAGLRRRRRRRGSSAGPA